MPATKGKTRILLVDDDPNIVQLVRLYLEKEGYEVETADRGDTAVEMFRKNPPHLMLLDIMLPGMDGWAVCREIRRTSNIPIIMLSAKGETFDRVLGLELGADDYIVKPFEPKELVARIKAVSRRYQSGDNAPAKEISFTGLTVNISRYSVVYAGKEVTPTRCLPASSCWSRCGGSISSAIPARWTCMSSACAKNCRAASSMAGRSRRCGAWAISSR